MKLSAETFNRVLNMKLSAETFKGSKFEIEANHTDAVSNVKKSIEKVQGADVYPASKQMLIYQGKVLNDTTTLGENNVTDNSYLFIMLSENKPAVCGASSASPAPASQGIPEQAGISPVVQTTAAPPTVGQAGYPLTEAPEATAAPASGLTTGVAGGPAGGPNASPLDLFLQGIPNVGLSAGAGSLDSLHNDNDNQQSQAMRDMVQAFFQKLEPMFEELWNMNPQLMLLIQEHQSEFLRLINLLVEREEGEVNLLSQLTSTMPPTVSVTPEEGEAIVPVTLEEFEAIKRGISNVGLSAGAGSLSILGDNSQFQATRDMVENFFCNLELDPMFEKLGKQNPLLMGVILKHKSEFLRLINEPVEGGKEMVSATPEDVEAIKRLEAMGNFREGIVREVYYGSDRDEKIAATFLHDHGDEFLKRG